MSFKKISDLLESLNERAPFWMAEAWDNVGLLVGNAESPVSRVLLSDDLTPSAVQHAREVGAELILNHHPCIFKGLKSVTTGELPGLERSIYECVRDGIAVLALHTNFDRADTQVGTRVAKGLGLQPEGVFDERDGTGYGVWGVLEKEQSSDEFFDQIKKTFDVEHFWAAFPFSKRVKRVGFTPGKGASFVQEALTRQLDVFITGEVGYHEMLRARNAGLCVVELGHRESERFFPEVVGEWLRGLGVTVELDWVPTQTIF